MMTIGKQTMAWLDRAATFSEPGPGVTRELGSPQHQQLLVEMSGWFAESGADAVWLDAAGNLVGHWEGRDAAEPTLILGSHQDTVHQGGRYDGIMGILLPLAVLRELHRSGESLPASVELVAFSDEEGARFASTLVGSSALAGCFPKEILQSQDKHGITLEQALRDLGAQPEALDSVARRPENVSAFVEVHIEQGPILEDENLPVGVVTAITGIERHIVQITGQAGHAGTTPMHLRRDALLAASHAVQAVNRLCRETDNLVGVVGQLQVVPNSVNVIPSGVEMSIELRSPDSALRRRSREILLSTLTDLMAEHGVTWTHKQVYEQSEVTCSGRVQTALAEAVEANGYAPRYLFSGAGHDGLAMARLTDIGMLFVRCQDGLSHHPDESVTTEDLEVAGQVLRTFLCHWPPGSENRSTTETGNE